MRKAALVLAMLVPVVVPVHALAGDGVEESAATIAHEVGKPLRAWSEGELDIHHINTGRGEAQLLILPDGTSVLVDASGKTVEHPPFSLPSKPDASRPPGEWVARYAMRALPEGARAIDYALVSHFHGDHMGAIAADSPRTTLGGDYRLSGFTQVAELVPIARLIDRGWPGYDYPEPIDNPTVNNYRRFIDWQIRNRGLEMERFQPGRNDQVRLLHRPEAYPQFELRNLYANGVVWTGEGNGTRNLFPPLESLARADHPTENKLSLAFRISYGAFGYFSGGDLSSIDEETASDPPPWKDVEPPVALASGPVDVLKANHHGSWDANGIPFLAALRPRVIVVASRAEGHPAANTYRRMTSRDVWPGERDIFITNVSPATFATTYGVENAASTQGHVVVRVEKGGATYRVFVLDDDSEAMTVKAVFGPYASN
ncbi:hypothetical protein E2F46_09665 [Luteimonas aestuarii]|uniref:MBL fold metallo-hydrolase n=1 Tax=Luteimonas aestuarii TaxID=453837 RepID=A0A4R5TMG5_9GAMM|nr:hypothetical protein [Luteimonas aestuarii]TDK23789.1 hypothetical protein E2F46_09665 [Luteimonas aestuarii]